MNLKYIFLSALFLSSILSSAGMAASQQNFRRNETSASLEFYLIGVDVRQERGASQNIDSNYYQNTSIGFRKNNWSFLVESSSFSQRTGNDSSNLERSHQELMVWSRAHLFAEVGNGYRSSFFAGLGLGGYQEQITSNLLGQSRTDSSGSKLMTGVAVGVDGELILTAVWSFVGALEIRGLFASDFDPNPSPNEAAFFGIKLKF